MLFLNTILNTIHTFDAGLFTLFYSCLKLGLFTLFYSDLKSELFMLLFRIVGIQSTPCPKIKTLEFTIWNGIWNLAMQEPRLCLS